MDCDWLVIGRGRSADVVLAEPTISRSHAAIGFDATGFFVQDLGSTNGTLVNGCEDAAGAAQESRRASRWESSRSV